jgi:hypothetical protein
MAVKTSLAMLSLYARIAIEERTLALSWISLEAASWRIFVTQKSNPMKKIGLFREDL